MTDAAPTAQDESAGTAPVIEWARRVGRAQLQHERVEFDRVSLGDEWDYREAVRRLSDEIAGEMRTRARSRLAARLESQPLLRAFLYPHGSTVIIELLVMFTAVSGGVVFFTRTGIDFGIAVTISAVLCPISVLLMTAVVIRESGRGPVRPLTITMALLAVAGPIPALALSVATGTLTDPDFTVRWVVLAASAVIAVVLLVLLERTRRVIGAAGRARVTADLQDWAGEVRATHAEAVRDAGDRLAQLWAAVPPERRAPIEAQRGAAVQVLAERGLLDQAEALRGAVPGALELDMAIATAGGWGAGSAALTTARVVPVVDDRTVAAG